MKKKKIKHIEDVRGVIVMANNGWEESLLATDSGEEIMNKLNEIIDRLNEINSAEG